LKAHGNKAIFWFFETLKNNYLNTGSLMLAVWILFASTGIIVTRYIIEGWIKVIKIEKSLLFNYIQFFSWDYVINKHSWDSPKTLKDEYKK
jgi:hypothetical protein